MTPKKSCSAAANLKGEHIQCDQPENHAGWAHGNKQAELIWKGIHDDEGETRTYTVFFEDMAEEFDLTERELHTVDKLRLEYRPYVERKPREVVIPEEGTPARAVYDMYVRRVKQMVEAPTLAKIFEQNEGVSYGDGKFVTYKLPKRVQNGE